MPQYVPLISDRTLAIALAFTGSGGPPPGVDAPTESAIRAILRQMRANPIPLARPVLILNGYHTPPHVAWWLASRVRSLTSGQDTDICWVSYAAACSIDSAAQTATRVVRALQGKGRWSGGQPFDVIGISMGGLVARVLAADARFPARIKRVFTFATPHQGSSRARVIAPDRAARDMKPGSAFLRVINTCAHDFELVCYAQQGDTIVTSSQAAPPGHLPIVGGPSRRMCHFTTAHNPWLLGDLARRLRGEPALLNPTLSADTSFCA